MDNKARRNVLDETQASLTELGNMLEDLKHTTDKMRQLFWEQEKKLEYLKRDLSQVEDQRRQKMKEQDQLKKELAELEKTLQIKKMELAVEKENEEAIVRHKMDLNERLQALNREVIELEEKQKIVSFHSSPNFYASVVNQSFFLYSLMND